MEKTYTNGTPVDPARKRRFGQFHAFQGTRRRDYWNYLVIFGLAAMTVLGLTVYRVASEYRAEMNYWQARQSDIADVLCVHDGQG
jgi:hypothetical protein